MSSSYDQQAGGETDFGSLDLQARMTAMAGWLDERKARNIRALDVRGISGVTDGVLIASALSVRQARALAEWMVEKAALAGQDYLGMEGQNTGNWILVDFNDVMVHIFLDQVREYYNLEGLYAKGRLLDPVWENKGREQEGA